MRVCMYVPVRARVHACVRVRLCIHARVSVIYGMVIYVWYDFAWYCQPFIALLMVQTAAPHCKLCECHTHRTPSRAADRPLYTYVIWPPPVQFM